MSLVELQEGMTDLIPCNRECGGDYARYSFTQTDKEVTVNVPLPSGVTSKMLKVEIKPTSLLILLRCDDVVLSGNLFKPVKASDSTWFVQDGHTLVVTLVKTNLKYEEWWPHVVEGEEQIDMKTLRPPEVHISELDDKAQATVARMMHEHRQKNSSGLTL